MCAVTQVARNDQVLCQQYQQHRACTRVICHRRSDYRALPRTPSLFPSLFPCQPSQPSQPSLFLFHGIIPGRLCRSVLGIATSLPNILSYPLSPSILFLVTAAGSSTPCHPRSHRAQCCVGFATTHARMHACSVPVYACYACHVHCVLYSVACSDSFVCLCARCM